MVLMLAGIILSANELYKWENEGNTMVNSGVMRALVAIIIMLAILMSILLLVSAAFKIGEEANNTLETTLGVIETTNEPAETPKELNEADVRIKEKLQR